MSDAASSGVSPGTNHDRHEALTPHGIEALLDDFRTWLHEAVGRGETVAAPSDETPIDLHTLLAQLTALRHEVNLQTRAARNLQDQNAQALERLSEALQSLTRKQEVGQDQEAQRIDEIQRPLLKTLVDVFDALALAGREVKRVQESLRQALVASQEVDAWVILEEVSDPPPLTSEPVTPEPGEEPAPLPFLTLAKPPEPTFWGRFVGLDRTARWLHQSLTLLGRSLGARPAPRPASSPQIAPAPAPPPAPPPQPAAPPLDRICQALDSVVVGYTMSLQRVERTLRQSGLEPIAVVGQPFDPERMEVLDVVVTSDYPSGEVLEEVRRGYLWRDRVFRYAQVRVAKS